MMNISKRERAYRRLCIGCPNEKKCHDDCTTCERFERFVERKPKTKRFKQLTHQEKCEIYNMGITGQYFIKEITAQFNITVPTYKKVMYAFQHFLRTGTPKDL